MAQIVTQDQGNHGILAMKRPVFAATCCEHAQVGEETAGAPRSGRAAEDQTGRMKRRSPNRSSQKLHYTNITLNALSCLWYQYLIECFAFELLAYYITPWDESSDPDVKAFRPSLPL